MKWLKWLHNYDFSKRSLCQMSMNSKHTFGFIDIALWQVLHLEINNLGAYAYDGLDMRRRGAKVNVQMQNTFFKKLKRHPRFFSPSVSTQFFMS